MKLKCSDEEFINVCKNAKSMLQAAFLLNLHYNTFKRYALQLQCFKPNQGGKNTTKYKKTKINTDDILNGKFPEFQTFKLKKRLLANNLLKNKCGICGIEEWQNKLLNMELHHKDGDSRNHNLENLQMICPNCHAQTINYRAKNINKNFIFDKKIKFKNNIKYKINENKSLKLNKINNEIDLILNSNIDFSIFGWVNKASEILQIYPQKVNNWMKKYMPEFYNNICFKRKSR